MTVQDKIVLITGTKRIGSAVGLALAAKGAHVALTYNRSRAEAEDTASQIRELGRKATAIRADVTQADAVRTMVGEVTRELGDVSILVNMASIYQSKPFSDITESDWDANLNANLKSAFLCAKAVIPSMIRHKEGRIINFADWVASSGRPRYVGYLPYYVSKVGVIGLTEALALELAPHSILVNAISPGPILAPPDLTEEESREVVKATPLGRWGGEAEIAKAVLSLVESDFITGECIRVDGGRHIR
ncbi:MAG: SDR family oxidoreductase [Acidobacteriota bacterium]